MINSIPNHGDTLVDKRGSATGPFQRYLDDITLVINSDRAGLPNYTVTTVPSATGGYGMIMVTDEAGGPVMAFSDLTDWRRCTDRVVIS